MDEDKNNTENSKGKCGDENSRYSRRKCNLPRERQFLMIIITVYYSKIIYDQ